MQVEDGGASASAGADGSNNENAPNAARAPPAPATGGKKRTKTVREVHDEIQAIIRQITASVSFVRERAGSRFRTGVPEFDTLC